MVVDNSLGMKEGCLLLLQYVLLDSSKFDIKLNPVVLFHKL